MPANRHWVGTGLGQGRFWDRASNWSATQGGAGGAGVPTAADDVFIDGGGRMEINATAFCRSFTKTAAGQLTDFRSPFNLTVGVGGFLMTAGTFDVDVSNTVFVAGNFQVTGGTFLSGTGTIVFNGAAAQSISLAAALNNVTFDNPAGIDLGANLTVNATMTLDQGVVRTGAFTIIRPAAAVTDRLEGHVFGNLRKGVAVGPQTVRYEVGGSTAYAPVTLAFGNVTTPGSVTVASVDGDHPSLASSDIIPSLSVNRYWSVSNTGTAFTTYSATFGFRPSDLDPSAATGIFVVRRFQAGWNTTTTGARTDTSTQATGLTSFGEFAIGDTAGTYTISASAVGGGTISPSGSVGVVHGSNQSFAIAPNAGYHIDSVVVDGVNRGEVTGYDFTNVTANHAIAAYFSINVYTVTATASAGGSISPSGSVNVNHGADQAFTVAPIAGYHIDSVVVDGVNQGAVAAYDFTNVTANHAIAAYFSINVYAVPATASAGGSISPSGPVNVNHGADQAFTVAPDAGYHIDSVVVDGVNQGAVGSYTFTNVKANRTIAAYFSINVYTITATASAGGSISPSGSVNVNPGADQAFTVAPDAGYHIDSVVVDGVNQGAVAGYDFTNVTDNHAIAAYFSINVYTVTATASAGGSITPSGSVNVNHGADQAFTVSPDAGYHIDSVVVDGVNQGAVTGYDFTNVTANHAIAAYFSINVYTVSSAATTGGSMSPSGSVPVTHGDDLTVTLTPSVGYFIADVLVDSASVGAVTSHTFTNVTANHSIFGVFDRQTFTITAAAGPNGSITPPGVSTVVYDSSVTYAITPDVGYYIADVRVDSVSVGAVSSHTFTNATANHTIEATFSINTYSLTATAGPNGSITPAGTTVASHGDTVVYAVAVDPGYFIADVHVDSVSVGPVSSYAFNGVTANHLITASFSIIQHTITASATAGGTITPSGAVAADHGSDRSFLVAPSAGHHLDSVVVDGVNLGAVPGHDFSNITADHSIAAYFSLNTYVLTATAGPGGSISPAGAVPVGHGGDQTFTITPAAGYFIADVHVDTVSVGAVGTYTFTGVTGPHAINATFALRTYSITAAPGPNGSITPSGVTVVSHGDTILYTITPNTGYFIANVTVDTVNLGPVGSYAFEGVTSDHVIGATFSITQYTIAASASSGGSISPAGTVGASHGDDRTFTMTADAGHHLDSVLVDGINVGAPATYTFTGVSASHTIAAYFSINVYPIAATAGSGGSIAPAGTVGVTHGADRTFTITPDTGWLVADVLVDSVSVGAVTGYTFTGVTGPHAIHASFVRQTFTVTATAGPNGTVSPAGGTAVGYGDTLVVTVTPDSGYFVEDVLVDGVSVGPVTAHAFEGVTAAHTLHATFSTNAPPSAALLIAPADGDTVAEGSLGSLAFTWGASVDPNPGDAVTYTLRITGPGVAFDTSGIADTTVTLDLGALLTAGNDYDWTVDVTDGAATTSSPDTFRFHVSPATGVEEDRRLPRAFALGQNYPNPFNPVTSIPFDLPERSTVTLKIFNVLGVEVLGLVTGQSLGAGSHSRSADFTGLPTGAYFYRLTALGESGEVFDRMMKLVVVR